MAFGDSFPTEFINTTDFTVTRFTSSSSYGDDSGSATTVAGPFGAVVVQKSDLIRTVDGEEISITVDVLIPPKTRNLANIRHKDRCAWSMTPGGSFLDHEVVLVENVSGVDGIEHVRLRLGQRV